MIGWGSVEVQAMAVARVLVFGGRLARFGGRLVGAGWTLPDAAQAGEGLGRGLAGAWQGFDGVCHDCCGTLTGYWRVWQGVGRR